MSIYAVNSKEPIAAWIPSLDTAGNGTTTLTDLVGSNNGTLTNFALTGSTSNWVADTDAGGVRALDSDGNNDYTATGFAGGTRTSMSLSVWCKINSSLSNKAIFGWWTGNNGIFLQTGISNGTQILVLSGNGGNYAQSPVSSFVASAWHHIVMAYDGSQATDAQKLVMHIDGSQQSLTFNSAIPSSVALSTGTLSIADVGALGRYWPGRIDDMRVFSEPLSGSDVSYLYNSGAGRGRVAATGKSRRRRQSVSGGVL